MKEIKMVGLAGKPKSGKTEVANYLEKNHGFVHHVEMNELIIAEAKKMLGAIGIEYIPDRKGDFRLLLQFLGYYRRLQDPDYWIKPIIEVSLPAVIGGVRYPNEVEEIHKRGGVVWNIIRPAAENNDTAPTEVQLTNFKFDTVIENNGTLNELYKNVDIELHKL